MFQMHNQGQFKVSSFVSLVHFRSVLNFLKRWKAASASVAFIHQVHSIRCWWHTRVSSRTGSPSGSTHLFETWEVCIKIQVTEPSPLDEHVCVHDASHWRRWTRNIPLASKGASFGRTAGGNHSCLHQISQWRCESDRDISSNAKKNKIVDLAPVMKENSLWNRRVSATFHGNSSEQ